MTISTHVLYIHTPPWYKNDTYRVWHIPAWRDIITYVKLIPIRVGKIRMTLGFVKLCNWHGKSRVNWYFFNDQKMNEVVDYFNQSGGWKAYMYKKDTLKRVFIWTVNHVEVDSLLWLGLIQTHMWSFCPLPLGSQHQFTVRLATTQLTSPRLGSIKGDLEGGKSLFWLSLAWSEKAQPGEWNERRVVISLLSHFFKRESVISYLRFI